MESEPSKQAKENLVRKHVPCAEGDASKGVKTVMGEAGGQSIKTLTTARTAFWQRWSPTGAHIHSAQNCSGKPNTNAQLQWVAVICISLPDGTFRKERS